MLAIVYAVVHLLIVHGPDNQMIELNATEISSIREPRKSEGHFHKDVQCLIIMTNNNIVGVTETCQQVTDLLQNAEGRER